MKVITVANDKGGVAKTTTVINLGVGLGMQGKKVLIVDLDGQANATSVLVGHKETEDSIFELLTERAKQKRPVRDYIVNDREGGIAIIPSDNQMKGADVELGRMVDSQRLLLNRLKEIEQLGYDYVLIDTPPTSTLVKLIGLFCADLVLSPITPADFSTDGLMGLVEDLALVSDSLGKAIDFRALLCMSDYTRMTTNIRTDLVEEGIGDYLFETYVPTNTTVREASRAKQSVLTYDPRSKGALAYQALVKEVLAL